MLKTFGAGQRDSTGGNRPSAQQAQALADNDRPRPPTNGPSMELDAEWMVGGKYEVLSTMGLYSSVELFGDFVCEMQPHEVCLLLQIQATSYGQAGLVIPPAPRPLGWVPLEDPSAPPSNSFPLLRRHLQSSWKMKSRYQVLHPATLRSGPLLSSEWVGEVASGDEVLVLELGFNCNSQEELSREVKRRSNMESRTRLRMLVSTDTGLLGWMSPETSHGEQLLDPINLLGPEGIRLSRGRRSVTSAAGRANGPQADSLGAAGYPNAARTSGVDGARTRQGGAAVDLSMARPPDVGRLPWKVGGTYRCFEDQPLIADLSPGSAAVVQVARGTILHVVKLDYQQCHGTGWCPYAKVSVQDGDAKGSQGWVRCISQTGFDLLDTRDQLQFERVTSQIVRERERRTQLLASQGGAQRHLAEQQAQQQPSADPGGDESEDEEEGSETESAVSSSAASGTEEPTVKPPAVAGSKNDADAMKATGDLKEPKEMSSSKSLLELEVGEAKEELHVMDGGTIQDEGWGSCLRCSCGTAGRAVPSASTKTLPEAPPVAEAN